MISNLKDRTLTWYFENVWLPEHSDRLHGSMIALLRRVVADFVAFAECDPRLKDITDETLAEFERFNKSRKFSPGAAQRQSDRIREIREHALPVEHISNGLACPLRVAPADGSLRQYVRKELPTIQTELRPRSIDSYANVVNCFCRWLGENIATADVSPEMIDQYEESGCKSPKAGTDHACRLRTLMRTYDPVRFRKRRSGGKKRRRPLNTGNGSEYLFSNIYEKRYEPTALRSRAVNTKRLYRTTLLMIDRFLGRSATLDDLNDDTISKFAAWRLQSVAKHTVNKDLFNVLALWRWCHRLGLVDVWPSVEMEKAPRRTPIAWTETQMRKLYQTIVELPGRVGKIRACEWWAALILVAWDTGERIHAIMQLDWSNVDLARKWVRFRAEDRKGGRDDSTARLSDETIAALRKLRAKEGPVFPWPYAYNHLWVHYGKILKLAGLPNDSKSKFHRIRKTVASYAEARGGDATKMLRHSKREITEAYLDPKIVIRQQPVDVLFRLTGKESA
jgi:integrase